MTILFANFLGALAYLLDSVLGLFVILLIARAVISWVNPDPYNPIVRFLTASTDPVLLVIRRVIPRFGGPIDFTPLIALLLIYFLKQFLVQTLFDYSIQLKRSLIVVPMPAPTSNMIQS